MVFHPRLLAQRSAPATYEVAVSQRFGNSSTRFLKSEFRLFDRCAVKCAIKNGREKCQDALYLALEGTSWSTIAPGPIQAPRPILTPGKVDTLIPVFAPSPKMAPSFFLPLRTQEPRSFDLI